MNNDVARTRDDLDKWTAQWDKAQADGVFEDSPKQIQQLDLSPDGATDWQKANPELLQEDNKDAGNVAASIAQSPNPVRQSTAGKDQELEPGPLGLTFSEKDIEDLSELKIKLHNLQDKLNTFEGRGENSTKFESQINSVKDKIEELSTAMTQAFPYSISPQGD